MVIVIPMAGESRRFTEAGYSVPKYELLLSGQSVFHHSVDSFASYVTSARFIFVHKSGSKDFIRHECDRLEINNAKLVELADVTRGQAETVLHGIDAAGISNEEAITIFNIDTFRPRFRFPEKSFLGSVGGYLEVFKGSGPNWSYVLPDPSCPKRVLETAEKVEISDLCCTGLYHFSEAGHFKEALSVAEKEVSGELYVAPLYNHLIKLGIPVGYHEIPPEDVVFCGVPAEYENLKRAWEIEDG